MAYKPCYRLPEEIPLPAGGLQTSVVGGGVGHGLSKG